MMLLLGNLTGGWMGAEFAISKSYSCYDCLKTSLSCHRAEVHSTVPLAAVNVTLK
jgi:hypothetical protein